MIKAFPASLLLVFRRSVCPFFVLFLFAFRAVTAQENQTSTVGISEILAKHVNAIGSPENRRKIAWRAARGRVEFEERLGGKTHLAGGAEINSTGGKVKCAFHFGDPSYPGERFVFDGLSVRIAGIDEKYSSRLGAFLSAEPGILREGLWGGALSTAWPLLDTSKKRAQLSFAGLKTLDQKELYEINFVPESDADRLSIRLYFDPVTFRHVSTVYRLTEAAVSTIVEERFDDFRETDGLTLPALWMIRLRTEPANGFEYQWTTHLDIVLHHQL